MLPFVSLVVVNYNGQDIIERCLHSLFKIDYPKNRYEVIVVDNASRDKSISIIKSFKKVKLIRNNNNMGYVGINSCLNKVKGKYIFILNNDLDMEKNCPKKLVEIIENDKTICIVVPKFINYYSRDIESSGTWVSRAFYTGHYTNKNEKPVVKEVPYLGIEMVRTDAVKEFEYIYDPDYFIYAEDLDLSLRMRLLGYKTVFVPDAIIYHMHAATTKKSKNYKMTFLLERNLLMTYFKILSLRNIILFFPYVVFMRIVALIMDVITFKFATAFSRIKAILWVIFHFNIINKKRKVLQKMRTADDNFMLKVFSEKHMFRKKVLV